MLPLCGKAQRNRHKTVSGVEVRCWSLAANTDSRSEAKGHRDDGEPLTTTEISKGSRSATTGEGRGEDRTLTPLAKAAIRLGLTDVTQGHESRKGACTRRAALTIGLRLALQ